MNYTQIAQQRIFGKVGTLVTVPLFAAVVATVFLAHIPVVPAFLRWTYGTPTFGGW